MYPTKIIDNFYETPSLVRNFALQQNFYKRAGHYPGLRTDKINEIDENFFTSFCNKLCGLYFTDREIVEYDVDTLFQFAGSRYGHGFVHQDKEYDIAGVVYLTPDAPIDCGTSIYVPIVENLKNSGCLTDPFYSDEEYNENEYNEKKMKYNGQFKKIQKIDNVYNRLVCYDVRQWHAQDGFFGDTKENSRMIQVFFAKFEFLGTSCVD
jgi:hypothetical protein